MVWWILTVHALQMFVSFISGILIGFGASNSLRNYRQNQMKGRRCSAIVVESVQKLESEGKIKLHLSPADNAVKMLESILPLDLDVSVRTSIAYAISVLKSDFTHATVPVGLNMDSASTPRERQFSITSNASEVVVLDWLVSSYTRKASTQSVSSGSFKGSPWAKKVKVAVKFRGDFSHRHDENSRSKYIFEVEPDELEQIEAELKGVDEWDWDVWKLSAVSKGRPLQTLGWHLLRKWDLMNNLHLDEDVVRNWLRLVERMYLETEYHTSTHAADVLQAVHHFLGKVGAAEYMSTTRIFALLVAAIMHDVGHDGRTNSYHENAQTERALMFNDQSVQENFHCMTLFSSMSADSQINLLAALGPAQAKEVRRLVILLTLGTDMKQHFKHAQKFKSLVGARGRAREAWLHDAEASDELCINLLHAADLSNPCRPFDTARGWAGRVLSEFFAQGDEEERLGLPVSPLCSRNSTLIPASQIGFITFVVLPYFQTLEELFPQAGRITAAAEKNLQRWRALESEEARAAAAAAGFVATRTFSGTTLLRRADAVAAAAREI